AFPTRAPTGGTDEQARDHREDRGRHRDHEGERRRSRGVAHRRHYASAEKGQLRLLCRFRHLQDGEPQGTRRAQPSDRCGDSDPEAPRPALLRRQGAQERRPLTRIEQFGWLGKWVMVCLRASEYAMTYLFRYPVTPLPDYPICYTESSSKAC